MAKKAQPRGRKNARAYAERATPDDTKYPYTNTPGALRRFLTKVPDRPKPTRVNLDLLKSWGEGNTNARTIIRVLKRVGLVSASNEPTPEYDAFMHPGTGPAVLGRKIREVYPELFNASKAPHKEDDESLKRLFNIHAGGTDATLQYQIQTFKALADHARFDSGATTEDSDTVVSASTVGRDALSNKGATGASPTIHIDLHIHLPPDKSSRDYQAIFEDIGKYLLGRKSEGDVV